MFIAYYLFIPGKELIWWTDGCGIDINAAMHEVPFSGGKDLLKEGTGCHFCDGILFTNIVNGVPCPGCGNSKEPDDNGNETIVGKNSSHTLKCGIG